MNIQTIIKMLTDAQLSYIAYGQEVPDDIIQIKVGEKNEMKKLPRTGF